MAINLSLGRDTPGESKDRCYAAVRKFLENFTAQFGSINCLELTGVNLGTPEGHAAFKSKGQIKQCTDQVADAVRIVLEVT